MTRADIRRETPSPETTVTHEILHVKADRLQSFKRSETLRRICLDTGAQKSVVGKNQAKAYCEMAGIKFKSKPSNTRFKFGDGIFASIGSIPIRIPKPNGGFIPVEIDAIRANVPMLIGLEVMDKHKLVADNVDNKLVSKKGNWSWPITRKNGHLFVEWKLNEVLYTKPELKRLHLHFYHPSTSKMFNLISRARPEEATPATRKLLQEVTEACRTCQRFTPKPQSFKVSAPEGIVFNKEPALDLMFLETMPVLHIFGTQTHFSNAIFLQEQSTEAVWNAFLEFWATIYTGHPEKMRVDQGGQFNSKQWKERTD